MDTQTLSIIGGQICQRMQQIVVASPGVLVNNLGYYKKELFESFMVKEQQKLWGFFNRG